MFSLDWSFPACFSLLVWLCKKCQKILQGSQSVILHAQGGGSLAPQPLPPHKFTPHDVVELRPGKGDSEGPALASGVVYRVRDDVITVAVDESPDADLDQPMRLHKLANEVRTCCCRLLCRGLSGVSCGGCQGL